MKKTAYIFLSLLILNTFCSCSDDTMEKLDMSSYEGCIVVVPDIQYYTNDKKLFKYLDAIVNFCTEEQDNISFLLQTGDVTNNNQIEQWDNGFKYFFSKLPPMFPIVFCLGNHDYGQNGKSETRTSNIPNRLSPIQDEVMPSSEYDNYLRYVMLGNTRYGVLSLEFAPRNEALDWADHVIKANSDIPIIILTHAFLNNSGKMFDSTDNMCDNKYSQKYYKMGDDYLNDSKEIFDKIIYNNPNVRMVVCGHCISDNYIECLEKENINGDSVFCIMVNYQHYSNGGAGYIGILYYNHGIFNLRDYNVVNKSFGRVNVTFDI